MRGCGEVGGPPWYLSAVFDEERRRYQATVFDSARWDGFAFRSDDVVICAPQKSGTTWTQMICAAWIHDGSAAASG